MWSKRSNTVERLRRIYDWQSIRQHYCQMSRHYLALLWALFERALFILIICVIGHYLSNIIHTGVDAVMDPIWPRQSSLNSSRIGPVDKIPGHDANGGR